MESTLSMGSTEPERKPTKHNPLEQFMLLAKTTRGAACADLIRDMLETPGVYVFGEILDMANIKELENGPYQKHLNALNLFAYGTYKQYLENKENFIELTDTMIRKLQYLTIVTMATHNKCIPYKDMLAQLNIKNVRDLEDLIIESIYADVIHGKMDQKNSQLEIDYTIGRDIRKEDIGKLVETLQDWCESCESVLMTFEEQIDRANTNKTTFMERQFDIEREMTKLKNTLMVELDDTEEAMTIDDKDTFVPSPNPPETRSKKALKSKVGKASAVTKSWFKNFS